MPKWWLVGADTVESPQGPHTAANGMGVVGWATRELPLTDAGLWPSV